METIGGNYGIHRLHRVHNPTQSMGVLPGPWSVGKQFTQKLRTYINSLEAIWYWRKWWQISTTLWQTINRDTLVKPYQKCQFSRCRWVAKLSSGHCGHGKNMMQWLLLNALVAFRMLNIHHTLLMGCQELATWQLWLLSSLKALQVWLQEENTDPKVMDTQNYCWASTVAMPTHPESQQHHSGRGMQDQMDIRW